jgi:hypothetical protein
MHRAKIKSIGEAARGSVIVDESPFETGSLAGKKAKTG